MFVYKSRFLRRGEVWFDNPPGRAAVDWILYRNRSQPVPSARSRHFYNRLINLSKSVEELFGELEPRTAAKLREAEEKDHIQCEWAMVTDEKQLDDLERMWNQSLEARRRWGMLDRSWLREMISAGAFELESAREPSGALLAYGGLFRDPHRVQQLMMVSPPRATLEPATRARTNRACSFLIWSTMLRLKQQGVRCFDFGGWYPGTEDIQLLGFNAFKKSFGGEVVREFECEQMLTLKSRVLFSGARLAARIKEFRPWKRSVEEGRPHEATAS